MTVPVENLPDMTLEWGDRILWRRGLTARDCITVAGWTRSPTWATSSSSTRMNRRLLDVAPTLSDLHVHDVRIGLHNFVAHLQSGLEADR